MADGDQSRVRSDHDREAVVNGINNVGSVDDAPSAHDKGKSQGPDDNIQWTNNTEQAKNPIDGAALEIRSRMNDLPDDIVHITQGFIPVSTLLTRLAQRTHNSLQEKIAELAKMPIPVAAVNGTTNYSAQAPDDTSPENLRKKAAILNFVQDLHSKWVKALVITEWSRKADAVSKLIDLKFHIDQQRVLYDTCLDGLVNLKRDLTYARMPSPDLKTALQILSTGTAPWISDLNYIEPPALSPDEQLKWMNDLNTLLSLRLNLDDYDKIPPQFKDYVIRSGRVTFKVPGEFEVDLTIADEDFEKQFWFIDFRYSFKPAAASVPDSLRSYLEACINDVLAKEGLLGCYKFLHEFVLTSKINELKRQALEMSKATWNGTLVVEPLNRALAVQYWSSRTSTTGLKNWVLVAVDSGSKTTTAAGAPCSSQLVIKWYRDNKEIKDTILMIDGDMLSMETVLRRVIGKHIEFILTSIHDKLQSAPRFRQREAGMILDVSNSHLGSCLLTTEIGPTERASLLVEPTTGNFAVKPQSKFSVPFEHQLNNGRDISEDGVRCLENIRCAIVEDALNRRGSAMGWHTQKTPITQEELRSITKLREWTRVIWIRQDGWDTNWFVAVVLSLNGDEWWLLEANRAEPGPTLKFSTRLPLSKGFPELSDSFWTNLTLFATGMIAQVVDMHELHRHRIKSRSNDSLSVALSQQIRLPALEVDLSAIFPTMVFSGSTKQVNSNIPIIVTDAGSEALVLGPPPTETPSGPKQAWANNIITIKFKGVEAGVGKAPFARDNTGYRLLCLSEAIINVRKPSKFSALNGAVDRDLSYDAKKGEFCLRIRHPIGESVLEILKTRIQSIDRFVNFLEAMDKAKGSITAENVTLQTVAFRYGGKIKDEPSSNDATKTSDDNREWRITLDLASPNIGITIEKDNPHLRVVDLMRRLVNGEGGIGALISWLPISLQALEAIDAVESRWAAMQSKGSGQLEFVIKSLGWMSMRYTISAATADEASTDAKQQKPPSAQGTTHVTIEVRTKARRGETWWHTWRSEETASAPAADAFDAALKTVWESSGKKWLGLTTGAAGKPNGGVVEMLLAIDEAIRNAASSPTPVAGEETQSTARAATQPSAARSRVVNTTSASTSQATSQATTVQHSQLNDKDVVVLD